MLQRFLMLITYQSTIDEWRQPPQRRTINFIRRFSWRSRDERSRVRSRRTRRRPQSHEAHVIASSWSVEMDFYSSSFLLSGAALKDWMIDLACCRSSYTLPAASYTLTPKRARDLSIQDTRIIWRLVFLASLIYRGVIIRRSQRRRRHRSCITILRRALYPTSQSVEPVQPPSSSHPPPQRTSVISHLTSVTSALHHCSYWWSPD